LCLFLWIQLNKCARNLWKHWERQSGESYGESHVPGCQVTFFFAQRIANSHGVIQSIAVDTYHSIGHAGIPFFGRATSRDYWTLCMPVLAHRWKKIMIYLYKYDASERSLTRVGQHWKLKKKRSCNNGTSFVSNQIWTPPMGIQFQYPSACLC
jgi:hypothetical protein